MIISKSWLWHPNIVNKISQLSYCAMKTFGWAGKRTRTFCTLSQELSELPNYNTMHFIYLLFLYFHVNYKHSQTRHQSYFMSKNCKLCISLLTQQLTFKFWLTIWYALVLISIVVTKNAKNKNVQLKSWPYYKEFLTIDSKYTFPFCKINDTSISHWPWIFIISGLSQTRL